MNLPTRVPLRDVSGNVLAVLEITPKRDSKGSDTDALIVVNAATATEYGETEIQLKEAEVYEYLLTDLTDGALRLRSSLSARRKNLRADEPDAGQIETRNFCGALLFELVEGEATANKTPRATALVDVRSLKVDYRTEYRGMLRNLSERLEGLIVDAQSSAKVSFRSNFEDRTDAGWLHIQLELLRETLDGPDFDAALGRILAFPHERLSPQEEVVLTDRLTKPSGASVRKLLHGNPRRIVPDGHPLKTVHGVESIAASILVPRNFRDLDTPENRFVKYVLQDLRSFLEHAQAIFERNSSFRVSTDLAKRLSARLNDWLGRSFFQEIGPMRLPPLGSPVLQRKAGYREILRTWLRFRTAAELSWAGGDDVFHAGQRDVASLYEYWLFFVLLDWFSRKCRRDGESPAIEELVDGLEEGAPCLKLRKQTHLGPFVGQFSGTSRRLHAQFDYNRVFGVSTNRARAGSWTRRLHPDYTLTFWPEEFTLSEAEERELLVHVHFDAKYRVENIENLFGPNGDPDEDSDVEDATGNYNRQDLLKMHAYRDAIRRSQGAYVLYPGKDPPRVFRGFHEILPGLGAFGIAPDENGKPKGLDALDGFLDDVLEHLSNRATSQERVSYHVWESYGSGEDVRSCEKVVPYGVDLQESDALYSGVRALPPAEHMVLVAWYESPAQLALAEIENGLVYVRLGLRRGGLHVHPNFARTRHVLLRSHGGVVAPGLCILREGGYHVYTRLQLREALKQMAAKPGVAAWESTEREGDEENIYAVFKVRPDPTFSACAWDGEKLMTLIEEFETDMRNRLIANLGRTSPYPRLLPLKDLLKCMINPNRPLD